MNRSKVPLLDRVMAQVDRSGECWLWTGWRTNGGYGRTNLVTPAALAHRVVYKLMVGEIPAGLTLDHLCRNPLCVNPAHLEPVTQRENVLRGTQIQMRAHVAGTCIRGHPVSESSRRKDGSVGTCRPCAHLRYQARRKGESLSPLQKAEARSREATVKMARHFHDLHDCSAPIFAGPGCECLNRAIQNGQEIRAELEAIVAKAFSR